MRRLIVDITVALATVGAVAVLLFIQPDVVWVRLLLGIPLALLLPGAAVSSFVDREERLGSVEWLTLSVAASMAVTMFTSMALAATIGLSTDGLLIALAAVTLLVLLGAHIGGSPQPEVDDGRKPPLRIVHLLAGAAALVASASLVVAVSVPPSPPPIASVVQLWGQPDGSGGVRIGARNVDARQERYVLTVKQGDQMIAQQRIALTQGASHIFEIRPEAILTTSAPVAAMLTDEGGALPPRTISVWSAE